MRMDEHRTALLHRWEALIAGLRGRPGLSDEYLEEVDSDAAQDELLGVSALLGGHEQGMWDLTPAEEAELWDLAAEWELPDDLVMNEFVRAKSVRGRPIPSVRPKRPLAGGGHGPGRGVPGKREFPASWPDDDVIARTMDVARRPDGAVRLLSGLYRAWGERDRVRLSVLVSSDGEVVTSYPVSGPGVQQNPLDVWRTEPVRRLQALLDDAVPPGSGEPRASLDELLAVGEWPHVVTCLRALAPPPAAAEELRALAALAGLPAD